MKIRTGFVSNSSSSSFVMFCSDATFDDLKNGIPNITMSGEGGYEGRDYFKPDKETVDYLLSHEDFARDNFQYYKEYFSFSVGLKLNLAQLAEKLPPNEDFYCESFEIDHHNSDTFKNFKESYLREEY